MTAERRSPYLVLGVRYGASKAEAARAFVHATRRLRHGPASRYDLEDLNWALHAIEQRIDDPTSNIDEYRMPADPRVYEIPTGDGVLNPPVHRYPRQSPPTGLETLYDLHTAVIREVAAALALEYKTAPLPKLHYFQDEGPQ